MNSIITVSDWSEEDPSDTDVESSDEDNSCKTEIQQETESFIWSKLRIQSVIKWQKKNITNI